MKATVVVSTLLGLTAAHVMPRADGEYGEATSSDVSVTTSGVPLTTDVTYAPGGSEYDEEYDDEEYCDDEDGDYEGDDDEDGDGEGDDDEDGDGEWDDGGDSWPTIPVPETTSTVTTTSVYTVTACPETVTDCPVGHVTTEVVTDYTTYCPKPTADLTKYSTVMVTVTECPETVTDCPARTTSSVTTCIYTPIPTEETVYTTMTLPTCPGAEGGCYETHSEVKTSWYYAGPTTAASPTKTAVHGHGYSTGYYAPPTTVATTYAYAGTGGAPVPTAQPTESTYPVTAGVGRAGFSAAAIVAAVAAFVL